jgi:hypothetical protein
LPLSILSAFFRLGPLVVVVDDGILAGRQRAKIACSVGLLLLLMIVAHVRVDFDPNGRHVGTFICNSLIVLDKERR